MKVKKGDKVQVIAGKFKGTVGEVLSVNPKKGRLTVDAVNVKKRSLKKTDSSNTENFVFIQHPIHISNVKVVSDAEVSSKKETKSKITKKDKVEKIAKTKTTKTKSSSSSK